jgi:hypothetical protein
MIRRMLLAGLGGIAWLVGCSSDHSGPVAAVLDAALVSPAQDDGAVLFTVTGGPVDSVEAPGYRLYTTRGAGDTLRVILAGELRPGSIARIHIPDEQRIPQYAAKIEQVAARSTYLQRNAGEYSLTLSR